jgi:hypothetical protein
MLAKNYIFKTEDDVPVGKVKEKNMEIFFRCCGSGSGIRCLFDPWIQDPGSGIGFFQIPDLGSQTHIFESLVTIFWVKISIIL